LKGLTSEKLETLHSVENIYANIMQNYAIMREDKNGTQYQECATQ